MADMRISIITVSLNSESTIEKTIRSVIEQRYPNIEYIIIDGKSTDRTIEIINKYRDKIAYFTSESDNGIYFAMNRGISRATGEIIGIINSDDWYEQGALTKIAECYKNKKSDVIYGKIKTLDENNEYEIVNDMPLGTLWFQMAIPHPSAFVKRKAYERYGCFNTDYKLAADYELMLRLYSMGASFTYIPEVLATFRKGGASTRNILNSRCEKHMISSAYSKKSPDPEYYDKVNKRLWSMDRFKYDSSRMEVISSNLSKMTAKRIIIFGAGIWGKRICEVLLAAGILDISVVDSDSRKWGTNFLGIRISQPKIIENSDAIVIVAISEPGGVKKIIEGYSNYHLTVYMLEEFITMIMEED